MKTYHLKKISYFEQFVRWVNVKFKCHAFYPYLYLQLQRQKIQLQNEMDAKVQETKNNVSTVGGIDM